VRRAKAVIGINRIDRATQRHCWYVKDEEKAFAGRPARGDFICAGKPGFCPQKPNSRAAFDR